MIQPRKGPSSPRGTHQGPRKQYRYFAVSYPSRKPLVCAMRPDAIGKTACFRPLETWIPIADATVTCARCRKWIEMNGAEAAR